MDLASGYSDSINYGNGYTPLATGAINNNNADYWRNQIAVAQMAQAYNPYANSGGSFGAQTDYYSGLGRDYTTATGGNIFGNASGGGGGGSNPYASMPWWASFEQQAGTQAAQDWVKQQSGGGIGSDAVGAPNQPGVAVNWDRYFSDATGNQQPASGASAYTGYDYNDPNTFAGQGGWGNTPANPNMQALLGYTPNTPYSGGGIGSDMARAPYQPGNTQNPYASQPWWSTFERSAGPQGVQDWLKSQGVDTQPQQQQQQQQIPSFWQGVRDVTGMGQPGGSGYDPYAGLGNQGQQGVIDPMGYGTGGYQGNAIPNQTPVQPQQQQPNNLPWFWQSVRDLAGADPKDQSRIPQSDGGYPGATNPNYQPGGMSPQKPYESWLNAS